MSPAKGTISKGNLPSNQHSSPAGYVSFVGGSIEQFNKYHLYVELVDLVWNPEKKR